MHLFVYVGLALSALFGLCAPPLATRLPPRLGTWLLTGGGLLAASITMGSLSLLGFTLIAQSPAVASQGKWSDAILKEQDPVRAPIAITALGALAVLAFRVVRLVIHRTRLIRTSYELARALGGSTELTVIDQPGCEACAVPGRPGRIVISTGLLQRLDVAERRAVLAHERAHLQHHHYLHQAAAHLAFAASPFLWRLPSSVSLSIERWADEAAAAVCHREVVANALLHAAHEQGRSARIRPTVVLAAGQTDIGSRVQALHAPAPRTARWRVAVIGMLLLAMTGTALEAAHETEHLFENAQSAYQAGRA